MREPNLTLTLEALASSGLVLPAEQKASLENALLLKKAESGLANIAFVGKITTVNGKDYMISQAWGKGTILNKEVELESKLFYSQDGTKWADLPPVGDAEDTERVMRLRNPLTGDPALISTVEEAAPVPEKEEVEGEEAMPTAARWAEAVVTMRATAITTRTATTLTWGQCPPRRMHSTTSWQSSTDAKQPAS